MSNLKKLKKNRFGSPPAKNEASNNLHIPEPTLTEQKIRRPKTGRTDLFSTRVRPQFNKKFRQRAFELGAKKVELLEAIFELGERDVESLTTILEDIKNKSIIV